MAKALITNIGANPATLPMPFRGVLAPGQAVCVNGSAASVLAKLGNVTGMFSVSDVSDANPVDAFYEESGVALPTASETAPGSLSAADKKRLGSIIRHDFLAPNAMAVVGLNLAEIHAAFAANAAGVGDDGNEFPDILWPDVASIPTNYGQSVCVFKSGTWDGGDITIYGTDPLGNTIQESITPVGGQGLAYGNQVFATITKIKRAQLGVAAGTCSIGFGHVIALDPGKAPITLGASVLYLAVEAAVWGQGVANSQVIVEELGYPANVVKLGQLPTTVPDGSTFIFCIPV